jgi:restriction system protein
MAKSSGLTPDIYCVRADGGKYAQAFKDGGYVALTWEKNADLSGCVTKEQLQAKYLELHPHQENRYVIGQHLGNTTRFLLDLRPGDYVITPTLSSGRLNYGVVKDAPYQYVEGDPACPLQHRRPMDWAPTPIQRAALSMPVQYALRAWQTVVAIRDADQKRSFLETIGQTPPRDPSEPYHVAVLKRVLDLDAHDFELLVTGLLAAAGFDAQHVGKSGDGGVDAEGEMDIFGMARVRVHAQAKRYQLGVKIGGGDVKAFRGSIPQGAQGVFITTVQFQPKAREIAIQDGFPRIGTIDGQQLVDLLTEHWGDIDEDLRRKLRLKTGLIPD